MKSWSDYGESAQVSIWSSKKREVATLRNGEFWRELARNMSGEVRKRFLHGESRGGYAFRNPRIEEELGRKEDGAIVKPMMRADKKMVVAGRLELSTSSV